MERRVIIIPLGLEKDMINESIKSVPVNAIHFIINNGARKNSGYFHFSTIINKEFIDNEFVGMKDVQFHHANLSNIDSCIKVLRKIFKMEVKHKDLDRIYINISSSTNVYAVASYIFACQYSRICSVYDYSSQNHILLNSLKSGDTLDQMNKKLLNNGATKGKYLTTEIPLFPFKELIDSEISMLKKLSQKDQYNSIKDILIESKIAYSVANRISVSRLLERFENANLITTEKSGRKVIIKINKTLKLLASFY